MLQNYTFIADKRGVRRSFLLFFSLFLLQVTAFAQNDVRITIRENNITVIEALKKVEKQSGLSIGYNNSLLRDKPALNLNLDKITHILDSDLNDSFRLVHIFDSVADNVMDNAADLLPIGNYHNVFFHVVGIAQFPWSQVPDQLLLNNLQNNLPHLVY